MSNAPHGQVTAKDDGKGNLIIQIPSVYAKHYFGMKQKYISLGAKDTPLNRVEAMKTALEIQSDIESRQFNPSNLTKYKHLKKQLGIYNTVEENNVQSLLDDFIKNLKLEPKIRNHRYRAILNHLQKMIAEHNYTLQQQSQINTWVTTNLAKSKAIEFLAVLYRSIEWAKGKSKLPKDFPNQFKQYEKNLTKMLENQKTKQQLKPIINSPTIPGIQAHSEEYRDKIIAAFYKRETATDNQNKIDHLAYLIEFLFRTGCRHNEAFKLKWKDIEYIENEKDGTEVNIIIHKLTNSRTKIVKNSKVPEYRRIPVNNRVIEILEILKPKHANPNLLVFRNYANKNFNDRMINDVWNPESVNSITKIENHSVIGKMIKNGEMNYYMDADSTRHTFIYIQLKKGASEYNVADWVGESALIILRRYSVHIERDYEIMPL